uniref:Si:ch73-343l4.8 n=1 Tax=Cyprinus carpio TaxID=7962 RepID=A0A8C2IKY0_CYPCA
LLTDICVFWSCLSGGSRCLVLITVGLGLICVLLLVFIILLHISITAERDLIKSYKNTVEEFNQTINSLHDNHTDLTQKNLELETRVASLSEGLKKEAIKRGWFFLSTKLSWSDSRQYCRDRGADLVIINTEEKQRVISSLVSERVWISLSDREQEGNMKWVDNSPLKQGFWLKGEPNNHNNEDCIELNYNRRLTGWSTLNNWNDLPCFEKKRGICEK